VQFTHPLAPALTLDTVPAWQRRHPDAPSAELKVPEPHSKHPVDLAGENAPAWHALHWLAPCVDEYVPARQVVQELALPAGVYRPASHGWHALAPTTSEIVPGWQERHCDAPGLEYCPAPHASQDVASKNEMVPAWQVAQALLPALTPYCPGRHGEQAHTCQAKKGYKPASVKNISNACPSDPHAQQGVPDHPARP
jgi:hypothetical protein